MLMEWLPEALRKVIEQQYGLATTEQAERWLSDARVKRLRERGVATGFGRGVLRFAGASSSWRQRAMAACLGYGPPVAVSHLAAALLWGWDEIGRPPVTVTVPTTRSGRRPDVITQRRELPATDLTARFGLPVTTPDRTLVDVATLLPPRQVASLFDHLQRVHSLRADAILDRLPGRAVRPGHALAPLRSMAVLRLEQHTGSQSPWEDRVAHWLRDAGLPEPVRQHQVVVGGRVLVLDLAYPEMMVAVEFDGWEWHRSRGRFDRDRARATDLILAGWLLVLATAAHGEDATVGRVREALVLRGWPARGSAPAMLGR
jgi:hypothetical protein